MLAQFASIRVLCAVLCVSIALWLFLGSTTLAFVLTPDEDGVALKVPAALYVTKADGGQARILGVGDPAPGGGTISYLGVPAIGHGETIFFAAQVRSEAGAGWRILLADVEKSGHVQIAQAVESSAISPDCQPVLKTDPYLTASDDGAVAFVADRLGGGTALFRYANGQVTCETRTGRRTAEGHLIASIGFGSAQIVRNGAAILQVTLAGDASSSQERPTRSAIVLAMPGAQAREIAVQGSRTCDGAHYGEHFGPPAVSVAGKNLVVAFINRTDRGTALFMGPADDPVRTISVGSMVGKSALTYLSDGRPALDSEGSIAIEAATADRRLILTIRGGEPSVAALEGEMIGPDGARLVGIGEPVAALSGGVYAEGVDQSGKDRIFLFSSDTATGTRASGSNEIFPSSAAVDRNGRVAFLTPGSVQAKPPVAKSVTAEEGTSL